MFYCPYREKEYSRIFGAAGDYETSWLKPPVLKVDGEVRAERKPGKAISNNVS